MNTRGYLVHALSPLHAGVGQGVGLVDLPIAREATTRHPLVPGSSLKGVLRAEARRLGPKDGAGSPVWNLFGPDSDHAHDHAGALRISDARILLFPVRSDFGTFAWVTCPLVLRRTLRDLGDRALAPDAIPAPSPGQVATGAKSALVPASARKVVLDGLPFDPAPLGQALGATLGGWLFPDDPWWRGALAERLAVVHDDLFTWLVEKATDVRAHVRIGENGVVEPRALWYEETLPPESVLAGLVQVASTKQLPEAGVAWELLEAVTRTPIQVGGGATTGHGVAQIRWVGPA